MELREYVLNICTVIIKIYQVKLRCLIRRLAVVLADSPEAEVQYVARLELSEIPPHLDHAREAVAMVEGTTRADLDVDRKMNLALVRFSEVSRRGRCARPRPLLYSCACISCPIF
jgi:hypothetical protein